MSLANKLGVSADLVATIPDRIFTRGGASLDPRDDVWEWPDGPFISRIDFQWYSKGFESFVPALKLCLIPFVKGHASGYVKTLENAFRHFIRLTGDFPGTLVTPMHISSYGAKLPDHQRWRLGTLNMLVQKWVELSLPGIDPKCAAYLREQKKPGNIKGEAVRTRDPIDGPLSEEEYTALYSAVNAAYGRNELSLWTILLMRLLLACGGRISQYASLKIGDFKVASFVLDLPQVKTRATHARTSFLEFDISQQTGRLIVDYLTSLRQQGLDDNSAFFPDALVMLQSRRKSRAATDLFFGHCLPNALSQRFKTCIKAISPPTSRLNYGPLPITPRRFRYTFGTRLAEEGANKLLIANRMGHADLQHVDAYVSASPKIVNNIDNAMGAVLAPLARAFKGQLVEDETHTTHKGAPSSRIIDFRVSCAAVGSCAGETNGCAFNKPVACYTCFRFEPWVDAPHDKVLKRLLAERDTWSGDLRMAAVNDEPIRAVEEVITLCMMAQEERQGATDRMAE